VADSLIATRKIREQQAAQDRQVQALQGPCGLRRCAMRMVIRVPEVLDAQRSLFSAELQQVQLQRARLGAIVDLYLSARRWLGAISAVVARILSGTIIELSVVAEDAFLIKWQAPLGRKIGSQSRTRGDPVV